MYVPCIFLGINPRVTSCHVLYFIARHFAEQYNEFKVKQGLQDRLEDTELPDNLDEESVFNEALTQHQSQLQATSNMEARAKRTVEIIKIQQEIVQRREWVRKLEWEAEMLNKQVEIRQNQFILDQKCDKCDS